MLDIQIKEIDGTISTDALAELIRKAHSVNIKNGLHYGTAEISGEKLMREIEESKCYVACTSEGEIVGTCMLSKREIHRWYYSGEAAYIHLVAVHPDYQGQKIGTKLLEYVICVIKEEGKHSFCFLTTAERNIAFRKTCEKQGFILVWFSTYNDNNFYSVTYGKWTEKSPYSTGIIRLRYSIEKLIIKAFLKPGRRIRFINKTI